MALVNTKEMFKKAYEGGYAIGAFNINNMEIIQAITEAAGELKSPVVLQVSAGARKYAKHAYLLALAKAAIDDKKKFTLKPVADRLADHFPGKVTFATDLVGDDAKVYVTAYPSGTTKNLAETSRLECGVMISQKALDELGEAEFIKMLRFVDWMFYSKEAYTLTKWGPEGKTWQYADVNGMKVKQLLPGYKCGGLGIGGADTDTDIRLKWGYACGNYFYGHSTAESTDNFTPDVQDLYARYGKYKTVAKVDPKAKPTEDQREQLNLWAVPLIDNINAWTLKFVTGQKDINKDWDAYVSDCKNLNIEKIVNLTNEIYKAQ